MNPVTPNSPGLKLDEGINRPELFFGLIGAAGTDVKKSQDNLEKKLRAIGYTPISFRLSTLLADYYKFLFPDDPRNARPSREDERILNLMAMGDKLRETLQRGDAISLLAVLETRKIREEKTGSDSGPLWGHAFIFNSLKHPAEVETLRNLYGQAFFAVSTYCPREIRAKNLRKQIARSCRSLKDDAFTDKANEIIEIDQKRPGTDFGQDVRDTFHISDVFVTHERSMGQISRFIDLIFGSPFETPTIDEHGMFHASAAALRSADLSRQVGALITTKAGEFVAAGCNEVPAPGGGSYWTGEPPERDDRDFRHGQDANALMKYEIISEIFSVLKEKNWLNDTIKMLSVPQLTEKILNKQEPVSFNNARIASLIEFGRIVHAEMSAITEAARRGLPTKGTTLYCTTFPCHMCARHIISSGVNRVVYMEPYPKSMTKELYRTSVCVEDDNDSCPNAVKFDPFIGISPRMYLKYFSSPKRKDANGYILPWNIGDSFPRYINKSAGHLTLELGFLDPILKLTQPTENNGGEDGETRRTETPVG